MPLPGHFLKTPRGIYAYMVLGLILPTGQKWACKIHVEKQLAERLPANAVVHTFYWNPRKKR